MTDDARARDGRPAKPAVSKPPSKTAPKDAKQNDRNLDDGIEDSMDASDPPASVQP